MTCNKNALIFCQGLMNDLDLNVFRQFLLRGAMHIPLVSFDRDGFDIRLWRAVPGRAFRFVNR